VHSVRSSHTLHILMHETWISAFPRPQEPVTCPYSEPDISNPCPPTVSLDIRFDIDVHTRTNNVRLSLHLVGVSICRLDPLIQYYDHEGALRVANRRTTRY